MEEQGNMNIKDLKNDEKAVFSLRSLYKSYGYMRYKMKKFEEYDLYAGNKDFLVSDNVITFTDRDGKLMALKPDVTLSIIKNCKDEPHYLKKVYYNENVYRVSKGTNSFKELMQIGLECMGNVDEYTVFEVLMLAAKSLETISPDYVLDISHLGIISDIITYLDISSAAGKKVLRLLGEKNYHEISELLLAEGVSAEKTALLKALTTTYGEPSDVLPKLNSLMPHGKLSKSAVQLTNIVNLLDKNGFGDKIRINFSVINNMNYYNGIVFNGFINGISESVLSGGQYDNLMKKMRKKSRAIGFAVYLDSLERLGGESGYDVDVFVLYNKKTESEKIINAVSELTQAGLNVTAGVAVPSKIKYKKLCEITEKGVVTVENNA